MTEQRETSPHVVPYRGALDRRQDAERDADYCGEEPPREGELKGVPDFLLDDVYDRALREQRSAKIALRELPDPDDVLDDQGAVESQLLPQLIEVVLRHAVVGGLGVKQHRVARHAGQAEHDGGRADERHENEHHSANEKFSHSSRFLSVDTSA